MFRNYSLLPSWATDVTYIPLQRGFLYLVAIEDLFARKVLSWRLSNSLDTEFCLDALEMALEGAHKSRDFPFRPRVSVHLIRLRGQAAG
jgi:transposase InsO family protein